MNRVMWGFAFAVALGVSDNASSEIFEVDRVDDVLVSACDAQVADDCSLRGAVLAAQSDDELDTIVLGAGVYVLEDTSEADGDADLDVLAPLRIVGAANTVIEVSNGSRAFDIDFDFNLAVGEVELRSVSLSSGAAIAIGRGIEGTGEGLDLRLTGVRMSRVGIELQTVGSIALHDVWITEAETFGVDGGAMYVSGASRVAISSSLFADNSVANFRSGGALFLVADELSIVDTRFTRNVADTTGGAIHVTGDTDAFITGLVLEGNAGGQGGGAIQIDGVGGTTTISNSLFSANSVGQFGNGGAIASSAPLILERVTFVGNEAGVEDDALCESRGGAIYSQAMLSATNVTFSDNATLPANTACGTSRGGALFHGMGQTAELTHVTIAGTHRAGEGNAIFNDSTVEVTNTIIGAAENPCAGNALTSGGGNIERREANALTTCGLGAAGDAAATGAELMILPLSNNGGSTPTHAIAFNSIAKNAGQSGANVLQDQREFLRADAQPDSGAFEFGGVLDRLLADGFEIGIPSE